MQASCPVLVPPFLILCLGYNYFVSSFLGYEIVVTTQKLHKSDVGELTLIIWKALA